MKKFFQSVVVLIVSWALAAQGSGLAYAQMLQSITNSKAAGAAPTFTVNTAAHNFACSATTCTVTMALTAGHTYIAQADAFNPVSLQSASAGGTWVPIASSRSGNANSLFSSEMILISASSGSNPVFTFSGADGTGTTVNVRDVTATGGTPYLDYAHASLKPFAATTTVNGETPVLTGTVSYTAQHENNDQQATTSVTGGTYTNGVFDATNGPGWADQNAQTTTPPTWHFTSATGNANTDALALSIGGGTSCNDEMLMDGSGGSNGTTVTGTLLNNGTFGYPITGVNSASGQTNGWSLSAAGAGITFATAAHQNNLHTSIRTCGDGTTHSGNGTLGIAYDLTTTTNNTANFNFTGAGTKASYGFFYQTSLGSDSNQYDAVGISMVSGGGVVVSHVNATMILECFSTTLTSNSGAISISSNTSYWITAQLDTSTAATVNGAISVYETSGWTLVSSSTCTTTGLLSAIDVLQIGRPGSEAGRPSATVYESNFRLNLAGTYPLGP